MSPPRELPMAPVAPSEPAAAEAPSPSRAGAERYRVEGMDCASCAMTVEKVVAALDGVRAASVSFGNATLAVDGDVSAEQVQAVVARAGYRAAPLSRRHPEPAVPFWRRDARTVSTCLSAALLAVAVAADLAGAVRMVAQPLYITAMVVGGWPIARAALAALRRRTLDMNVLMTLAAPWGSGRMRRAPGCWSCSRSARRSRRSRSTAAGGR